VTLPLFLLILIGPFCLDLLIVSGLARRPVANRKYWTLVALYLVGCVVSPLAVGLSLPEVRGDLGEVAALIFLVVACRAIDLKGFRMWSLFRQARRLEVT
jgi:hypothetical protein